MRRSQFRIFVLLTDRLDPISLSDMPPTASRGTSRTLRMGRLSLLQPDGPHHPIECFVHYKGPQKAKTEFKSLFGLDWPLLLRVFCMYV